MTPTFVRLMSQVIRIERATNLTHAPDEDGQHAHRAYGVYSEADQRITLDDSIGFERERDTFMHENLHAMLAIANLDSVIDTEAGSGATEHVVTVLSPILLAWMRENPLAVEYLQESQ